MQESPRRVAAYPDPANQHRVDGADDALIFFRIIIASPTLERDVPGDASVEATCGYRHAGQLA